MILVDKDIKERGKEIIIGYNEDNVGAISYDLTLDYVVDHNKDDDIVVIMPNSTLIIRTKEKLKMTNDLLGRIAEKNSVMRMGLFVRGPHYQPGHETYCFLFVQNISPNEIKLKKGMKIAQIIFEELKSEPQIPYSDNSKASFNNEIEYTGFGKYEKEYNKYINKMESLNEELSAKETQIYANILTFMGIFVSIFSLITINFEIITKLQINLKTLVSVNLSLITVLVMFMSLILFVINKKTYKYDKIIIAVVAGILLIINACIVFIK